MKSKDIGQRKNFLILHIITEEKQNKEYSSICIGCHTRGEAISVLSLKSQL